MALARARGDDVRVLLLTDGEAAEVSIDDLERVRRVEITSALEVLGVLDPSRRKEEAESGLGLSRLALADGDLCRQEAAIAEAIDTATPEGATLVAPIEWDGHPDHEAAGRAALRVAEKRHLLLARYPIWAKERSMPEALDARTRLRRLPLPAWARAAKRRAIACHRSQIDPPRGPPVLSPEMLSRFEGDDEMYWL